MCNDFLVSRPRADSSSGEGVETCLFGYSSSIIIHFTCLLYALLWQAVIGSLFVEHSRRENESERASRRSRVSIVSEGFVVVVVLFHTFLSRLQAEKQRSAAICEIGEVALAAIHPLGCSFVVVNHRFPAALITVVVVVRAIRH